MNCITLTGVIDSAVESRSEADGLEHAATTLRFHKAMPAIPLFCYGDRAHQLIRFQPGNLVKCVGRLVVNPVNSKAAILVDSIHHIDDAAAEDRDIDLWNAARRHQSNAKVKGDNRWATRAGYVKA